MLRRFKTIVAVSIAALFLFAPMASASKKATKPITVEEATDVKTPASLIAWNEDETTAWVDGQVLHVIYTDLDDVKYSYKLEHLITDCRKAYGINTLELHMLHPGGNVFLMFDLIDMLEREKTEHNLYIITRASGLIASAGVPIFLVGDTRTISANCMFMIHPISGWNHPYLQDCDRIVIAEASFRYARYVTLRTGNLITYEDMIDMMMPEDKDSATGCHWYFPNDIIRVGLAHEIR